MKKLITVISIFAGVYSFAQCNISGKSTIKVLDEETYSVPTELAQCKDCHLWVGVGGNISLVGDNRQNTVKIKANSGGRQVISLAALTPQGLVQCSKNIDIVDGNGALPVTSVTPTSSETPKTGNCDIEVNNYKEVKYADQIVSFFPNVTSDSYKYNWTVTYQNGDSVSSTEKVPQFPFTKENGISRVKVKINSTKCVREFSKTYDSNYWRFFQ